MDWIGEMVKKHRRTLITSESKSFFEEKAALLIDCNVDGAIMDKILKFGFESEDLDYSPLAWKETCEEVSIGDSFGERVEFKGLCFLFIRDSETGAWDYKPYYDNYFEEDEE